VVVVLRDVVGAFGIVYQPDQALEWIPLVARLLTEIPPQRLANVKSLGPARTCGESL